MRIAIVSDIHGNRTAFEAVLADLRDTSPDLILHGGDLADGGSSPAEIVDHIRDLGWQGVIGNADEMLWNPAPLADAASKSPQLKSLFDAVEDIAMFTRETLGEQRIAWLGELPIIDRREGLALVHASPKSAWQAPNQDASDAVLEETYAPLATSAAVYGHIHRPFIRKVGATTVANTGSVSLSYTGDPRATYLLLDDLTPAIRFVEYDVAREIKALLDSAIPHAEWIAAMLETASFQMP